MKKTILTFLALATVKLTIAQVTIPMPNYGFNTGTANYPSGTVPSGLTANVAAAVYTTLGGTVTGQPSLSLKLAGEYCQLQLATQAGVVKYDIRGSGSGWSAGAIFDVQQSVDGVSYTTLPLLKTYNVAGALPVSGAFLTETVTPDPTARFIRWKFTNKISGTNVALDDISVAAPAVGAGPVIVVKQGSTTLVNNQTISFASNPTVTLPITLNIENYANVNALNITATTAVTGSCATDYAITTSLPFSVAASTAGNTSQTLTINFTPPVTGNRSAILTINSDDAATPNFVLNLDGVGGTLASEPTTTLSALTFTGGTNYNKSYRLRGSFTSSGSAVGYLVVRRIGSAPATLPSDGKAYMQGDTVGADKVVAVINTPSFTNGNVMANTNYYFAIYPFNGNGTFRNYAQTAALVSNVTSSGSMMPAGEYAAINTANATFIQDLTNRIDVAGRTKIYYSNYGLTMMKQFMSTDTTAGQKVATCVYSGDKYVYTEPLVWGYMSREHSYCHNWMPTNPADGSAAAPNNVERPEYNDQHHLFPTNQDDVNAVRSNNPLGEVAGTPDVTFLGCKLGNNTNGERVFEPRNEQKGNSARAIMYMAVAHNGLNDAFGSPQNWKFRNPISASIPYDQDQILLKKWNEQDLPDNYEIARNDFIDSLQGNRNPFVDHPEYACYIDFSTMTYISNPTIPCGVQSGVKENNGNGKGSLGIFPNPNNGTFNLMFNAKNGTATLQLFDVTGRAVSAKQVSVYDGANLINVNENLSKGVYTVKLSNSNFTYTNKLVVE